MSVYKKLQKARVMLLSSDIKKSGKNKFAGFEYFELADFLPAITKIFDEVGLCGVVRFHENTAALGIVNTEDAEDYVDFVTPLIYADMSKSQAIQNLGATHTYVRRYLWLMAMEIVEHDAVDAAPQEEKPKPIAKPKTPPPLSGKGGDWNITIDPNANWKDSVVLGVTKALDFAESTLGVETIWKENRALFDRLKEEDKVTYDDLLALLGTYKKKFQ
tara:strand:- start:154 stop:804 length:651 start_codon:yes stop_codon:yes gene_type:complete